MVSKISEGVTISVETFYQPDHSNAQTSEFMFAYRVTIENNNIFPVRLVSRHWYIFDSNGDKREVEGEGVIGVQPIIASLERYQYISGCNLKSEIGKMYGTYLMENSYNKSTFVVNIPAFDMVVPEKLN
ncbi:Co2+/Mg2+ efflux protein ApaG [soil metagenome]